MREYHAIEFDEGYPIDTKEHYVCGAPRIAGQLHYDRTEFLASEEIRKAAANGVQELPVAKYQRHIEWTKGRLLGLEIEVTSVRRQMKRLDRVLDALIEQRHFAEYELEEETQKKRLAALIADQEREKRLAVSGTKHGVDSPVKSLVLASGLCQSD
jgi:hypothetical protein